MKRGKRILTILLTLCVAFTMMPLAGIEGMTAYAADGKGVEGEYLDIPNKFDKEIDISKVSGDIVIKDSKTYRIYSSEKKTVNHKIKIQKPTLKNIEPHVFIDGISIAMDAGSKCPAIEINNKASAYLYFYGGNSDLKGADYRAAIQKNRSENNLHILVAGGTGLYCYGGLYAAGIGGSADRNTNWYNIDMYGHGVRLYFGSSEKNTKWNGEIRANGGKNGAGIGGGRYGTGERINIMSGKITAIGGEYGAGIGGGRRGNGNLISIYGGDITATGGGFAAGIGSGFTQSAKDIRIYGGTVTAKGGSGGAGIGSGSVNTEDEAKNISVSDIEISGGNVTAEGRTSGAGIGGGQFVRADNITITEGTVNAKSTYGGAGIGGGSDAIGHNITISGGDVYAKSYGGAGIGGGIEAMGDKIYLSGGHIKAECGKNLGNSPVAFGSGANIRNTNGMFNGTAEVPVEDVYIVLSHENQVDMKLTAECRSFDGIRGYQTFTDSITNNSYGMPGETQIKFSSLSLPNAQKYGEITIAAELTFKTKESKHQCFPATITKNMGKYHLTVCKTCGVRMFYNLTAESSRHDNLEWDTTKHEKFCESCQEAIERDYTAPEIDGVETGGVYLISNLPDGSPGAKRFYVTDDGWPGLVASGVKSVMLDGREIQMVNGAYQIPAMSGSLITSGNPLTYTVTAVDYAGNESEKITFIQVFQKHLLTIVDSKGKTIYSKEFKDWNTPTIKISLPAGANSARITNADYPEEKYTWNNGTFHITSPIRQNCTFRFEYQTELPQVSISGGNRSWNTYAASGNETVYIKEDDSKFTVSTTDGSAEYFVSEQALTEEALRSSEVQWKQAGANGEISIGDLTEFYIYAKAANAAGTIYVSTAKIVLDGSAPIAKVGTENLRNGAYYWNRLQFSIVDESPVTVTDNGVTLTPNNGIYTIAADEPEPRNLWATAYDDPTHRIVITDSCGNTTTYDNVKVLINYLEAGSVVDDPRKLPNGIDISNLPMGETASVTTTKTLRDALASSDPNKDDIYLPVDWDFENTAYDKTLKTEQSFRVYGTIDISGQSPQIIIRKGEETKLHTYMGFTVAAAETYNITVMPTEHGGVFLVDRPMMDTDIKAYAGENISFTLMSDSGYAPTSVVVTDSDGEPVEVTEEAGGYSYEQPKGGSTITVTFAKVTTYEIIHPTDATGFENGTELDEIMKALPESVGVMLNGDENNIVRASVSWDEATAKYDQSSRKAQSFTVKGTVDLSRIDLEESEASTKIKVSVDKESAGSDGGSSSGSSGGTTPTTPTDPSNPNNPSDNPSDDDTNLSSIKGRVSKMLLYARSSRTPNKNIKVVLKMDKRTAASIETLKKLSYTVKYKFYRSTKKSSAYKAKITKKTGNYINTSGKKGVRYYYKARILVYDKNGKLVAQTELKQCKYACRVR